MRKIAFVSRLFLVGLAAFTLTACAQSVVEIGPFDEQAAKDMLKPGTASVKGSAFIRQQGGGVVTCAGNTVQLVPETRYSTERMFAIYGNALRGYRSANRGEVAFSHTPAAYGLTVHAARCDAQGNFEFSNLSAGTFFVITQVIWRTHPYALEGGYLMQRISTAAGTQVNAVLSP